MPQLERHQRVQSQLLQRPVARNARRGEAQHRTHLVLHRAFQQGAARLAGRRRAQPLRERRLCTVLAAAWSASRPAARPGGRWRGGLPSPRASDAGSRCMQTACVAFASSNTSSASTTRPGARPSNPSRESELPSYRRRRREADVPHRTEVDAQRRAAARSSVVRQRVEKCVRRQRSFPGRACRKSEPPTRRARTRRAGPPR